MLPSLLNQDCDVFFQGKAAFPILNMFFESYPTPLAAAGADWKDIASMLAPLGLHEKRARIITKFSSMFELLCA